MLNGIQLINSQPISISNGKLNSSFPSGAKIVIKKSIPRDFCFRLLQQIHVKQSLPYFAILADIASFGCKLLMAESIHSSASQPAVLSLHSFKILDVFMRAES